MELMRPEDKGTGGEGDRTTEGEEDRGTEGQGTEGEEDGDRRKGGWGTGGQD